MPGPPAKMNTGSGGGCSASAGSMTTSSAMMRPALAERRSQTWSRPARSRSYSRIEVGGVATAELAKPLRRQPGFLHRRRELQHRRREQSPSPLSGPSEPNQARSTTCKLAHACTHPGSLCGHAPHRRRPNVDPYSVRRDHVWMIGPRPRFTPARRLAGRLDRLCSISRLRAPGGRMP